MLKDSAVQDSTRFDYAQYLEGNIQDSAWYSKCVEGRILRETGILYAFYYFRAEKLLCRGSRIWLNITEGIVWYLQHQFSKMRVRRLL